MRTTARQHLTTISAATLFASAALLAGCNSSNKTTDVTPTHRPIDVAPATHQTTTFTGDDVLARIGDTTVTRGQLQDSLFQAFGFDMLMLLVQRNIAHDACRAQGFVVSPEDIEKEELAAVAYVAQNTPGAEGQDPAKLVEYILSQPHKPGEVSTKAEWDIVMDTNAHLRKLAEPLLKDAITPEAIQQEFDERYGAAIQVRHLAVANPQEAASIKAKLAAGADFVDLIRTYSRNPDKHEGGLVPPFTIKSQKFPEGFKRVAFALKDGEVSDPVSAEGSYHLLRVEKRIAPKAIKIEDMREPIREDLQERVIFQGVKKLRTDFGQQALAQLKVEDPTLRAEFEKRLKARDQLIRDKVKIKEEMEKQRQETPSLMTPPPGSATQPAAPAAPATKPTVDKPAIAPPPPAPAPAKAPGGATTQTSPAKPTPATQP